MLILPETVSLGCDLLPRRMCLSGQNFKLTVTINKFNCFVFIHSSSYVQFTVLLHSYLIEIPICDVWMGKESF